MQNALQQLYNKLGFNKENGLYDLSEIDKCKDLALRYKNALKIIAPDSFFCFNNEPFILFFDLSKNNDPDILKEIQKKTWNFDKAPIMVVSTDTDIILYNAFNFDKKKSEPELSILIKEKIAKVQSNIAIEDYSFENIYSGTFLNKHKNKFSDNDRVYKTLFNHIKCYHSKLINKKLSSLTSINILTRVIFLRYLADRNVEIKNNNFDIISIFNSKDSLYKFFEELKEKFNGDLFEILPNEKNEINNEHISLLKSFWNDAGINGQLRLFPYNFSIIPVELISNVYEEFLLENREKNKSYYTPAFLVDYVITETISPFLETKNDSSCKVLDPACGSGIFLIESLRKIISKQKELTKDYKLSSDTLKNLVKDNIFGIDKDVRAINIAIFSLYITLLDYQDPKSILEFKFPTLKGSNFFDEDFFDINHNFNDLIKKQEIDFILSNPPYGSIKDKMHIEYYEKEGIPVNDFQIAESFLYRAKDFSIATTKCAMLVTSKILYNLNAKDFRTAFLSNFNTNQVLELSAVRKQIFSGAVTPASIIFYSYSDEKDTTNNVVKHVSIKPNIYFKLFKTLVIEKNDYKEIDQSYLINNDWLWKILLYGNILDFYFIKRIKDKFQNIKSLEQNEELYSGQGITLNGKGTSYKADHLQGIPFLDTKQKALKSFFVDMDKCQPFNKNEVHRIRKPELFKAPYVLLKRGINSNLSCVAAYSDKDLIFTNSVNAIKFKTNDKDKLLNLAGLLNSNFFNYLNLLTSASIAVEREEIYEYELLNFPYLYNSKIKDIVINLQKSVSEEKLNQLETYINESFHIDETEKDLIDYALNVSIPIWKYGENILNNKLPKALESASEDNIKGYVEVFYDYFNNHYSNFSVDVYYNSKSYTLINFKARQETKPKEPVIFQSSEKINDILKQLLNLSINQITKEIFIKKDIKGFQENSFYVIKTNEYKNWHKAIARRDLNEFINAIWEAEVESIKS